MRRRLTAALFWSWALTGSIGLAQGSESERFLSALRRAVDEGDRRAVASMVAYPATGPAGGFNIPVKDATAFVTMYKAVFTPELRCAVVHSQLAKAGSPTPAHAVMVSPEGLTIADGAIWAPLKNGRFRIARIRVPPAAPSVAGRNGTERVTFLESKGERSATFAGWLVRQNIDAYLVAVKKGETLQARIEGFSGHDATVRVFQRSAGERSAAPPSDLGRTGSATAPADGEYRIEVAHLAPYCNPPQRYKLSIALR